MRKKSMQAQARVAIDLTALQQNLNEATVELQKAEAMLHQVMAHHQDCHRRQRVAKLFFDAGIRSVNQYDCDAPTPATRGKY